MLYKALLAIAVTTASIIGGSQLLNDLTPVAEKITVEKSIKNVMNWALVQENLDGLDRPEALRQAILRSTDAEGIVVDGETVVYELLETCMRGEFTEYDTIVITDC